MSTTRTQIVRFIRNGKDGANGEDGNGISSQSSLFVATTRREGVTYENTIGWTAEFVLPTIDRPYVWKCVKTEYTKTGIKYSTAELVATYQAGANPNLLDNAAFTSEDNMSAWDIISEYYEVEGQPQLSGKGFVNSANGKDGYNSYYDICTYMYDKIQYKELLRQPLGNKLEPGKWYTFSFWAKGVQANVNVGLTSNAYGFAKYKLYLQANTRYTIAVHGKVSDDAAANGKYLRTYISDESNNRMAYIDNHSTLLATEQTTFTPNTTGVYYIESYMYDSSEPRTGNVQVTYYSITDGLDLSTYIYQDCVDTSEKVFVDGVEQDAQSDLYLKWTLSTQWEHHTVSFKTKATLPLGSKYVLFRLYPTPCEPAYRRIYLCMPKIETGMIATGFTTNGSDLRGDKGDRGPSLRGPQDWEQCLIGYQFQAGGEGDDFLDAVLYNGNYYMCMKTHTKTADNYPLSTLDVNNKYWKASSKLEFVATKILLAEYALVKNLGVEAIDMKDAEGNIIFQAKDGKVICNEGEFNNVRLNGFLYKKKTVITQANITEYTRYDEALQVNLIDVVKTGSWIEFQGGFNDSTLVLSFPCINKSKEYTQEEIDESISLVGNILVVNNNSTSKIKFNNLYEEVYTFNEGGGVIKPSVTITTEVIKLFELLQGEFMEIRSMTRIIHTGTTLTERSPAIIWFKEASGTL